jgi:transcriptional regulator with XRE-family HTH domain
MLTELIPGQGIKQSHVSRKSGVSESRLSRLINAKGGAVEAMDTLRDLERIEDALDLPHGYFVRELGFAGAAQRRRAASSGARPGPRGSVAKEARRKKDEGNEG